MRVIVNADDLGMSEQVNAAIFGMLSAGRITSATIMANGPAVEAAIRELKSYPQASFGVHMNLTEFAPLSRASGLRPLLDDTGRFCDAMRNTAWSFPLLSAMVEELSAQIAYLRDHGVRISQLDSHHHIHTIPAMFPVLKRLQMRFGIRRVRISWNYYANGRWPSPALLRKKRAFNAAIAHLYRTRTTEGFADLFAFLDNARARTVTCETFEIMVHPGADEREDQATMSRWEDDLPYPLTFMSYHDL
jgi:predicted glycoside hydrolase/deacetylase ChbG (UPF0249 family)